MENRDFRIIEVKDLSTIQKTQIVALWNSEYPIQLSFSNMDAFDSYLDGLEDKNHILLVDYNDMILGWLINFVREKENWFAMILNSAYQGKGFGTKLINQAKKNKMELNGWVIDHDNNIKLNGDNYQSPLKFYLKNDFKNIDDIRLETDKISVVKITWKRKP